MVNSHDVNQLRQAVRASLRDLPEDFFSHAPQRRSGELDVGVDQRSQTAGLRLLRLVAGFFALIWPPLVVAAWFRWAPDGATPDPAADQLWFLVFGAFTACSVLLAIAAVRHRRPWYLATFRISGYLYLLLFGSHLVILLSTGHSPLTDLHLADYSLIPTGLLMLTLPRKVGFPLVIGVKAVGSLTNQGLPVTATHIGEALWAGLLALPYLIMVVAILDRIAEIDRAATVQRRRVLKVANSRMLRDSETRFRGFLHDQVLQHLAGIRGGMTEPVPPEVDLTRSVAALGQPLVLPDVPVSGAIDELERIVNRNAPGSQLELPAEVPSGAQLPSVPAGVVGDAVGEALGNSVRHAPAANRAVRLEVDCDPDGSCKSILVTVTDDGPGFDPAQVGADRAGLQVSVFGRMAATPGCRAELDTAPGKGTRITLSWGRSLRANRASIRTPGGWLEEKLAGLGRVFHPVYGIFAVITVTWLGLLQDHPERPALFVLALAALLPVMWGLSRGVDNRLAARPTAVVAVAVVAFSGLAAAEQLGHSDTWPGLWFAPPFAMLCAFLAVRDRTLIAWLTFAVGLVPILVFGLTGPTPERLPALLGELAILMVIGSGFPWLLRRALRSLSVGLRADGDAATDLALATSQRSYLADSAAWLQGQLTAALDPELSAEVRRDNARLLEMRMRDTVRSPGFDVPDTNRAVWRARASDVTVQLRDDRSDHRGEDPDPDSVGSRNFHRQLQVTLETAAAQAGPGTVNARLSPLSRAEYGTIVAGSAGGEQQVVRIPRGQPETTGQAD